MRKANLRSAALYFALTLTAEIIFYAALVPVFSRATGGLSLPDTALFRPYAETQAAFDLMKSGGGLSSYRLIQLLDSVFPLMYSLAFASFIAIGLKRCGQEETPWRFLLLFPISGGLFDYAENILVACMMAVHPGDFSALAAAASAATLLKFICFALSLASMACVVIAAMALGGRKACVSTVRAPAAIGPYSQAVRSGGFLFLSGQLGMDPETGALAEGFKAQAERALDNVAAILEDSGLTMADIVKTTIFLADLADFQALNEIYASCFTGDYPARSAVQVAALPRGALIEIEAVAQNR
jgi:2-iminobutanoate/2-iminopropanoate deaminase